MDFKIMHLENMRVFIVEYSIKNVWLFNHKQAHRFQRRMTSYRCHARISGLHNLVTDFMLLDFRWTDKRGHRHDHVAVLVGRF